MIPMRWSLNLGNKWALVVAELVLGNKEYCMFWMKLFTAKCMWVMVLGVMMISDAGAEIEVDINQLYSQKERPLFFPKFMPTEEKFFLVAQGESIYHGMKELPPDGEMKAHFFSLDMGAANMELFQIVRTFSPVPLGNKASWSVAFSERQRMVYFLYAPVYGSEYKRFKYESKEAKFVPVKRIGRSLGGSIRVQSIDAEFLSSTKMGAVVGEKNGTVKYSSKRDGEPWGRWERFGDGWCPQLSKVGDDLSVFWLKTDDKSQAHYNIEKAPDLHLLKAPIRKGKVVLDEATRVASMPPCARIEVCGMDDNNRCLLYASGNSLYAMVGDTEGGSWTLPQKIILSKDLGTIKSLSAISWNGAVCFVVGTESGEIHMGKIPQETLSAIPLHHGKRPPVEGSVMADNPPVVSSYQQELKGKTEKARAFITLLGHGGSESEIQDAISFLKECPRMMADDIALLAFYDIQQNLQGMQREEWTSSVVSNCCECIRHLKHVGLEWGTKKEWDCYPELLDTVVAFHGGDNILPIVARSSLLIELKKYVDRAKRENSGDVQDVEVFIKKEAKAILKAWPEPEVKNMIKGLADEEAVPSS